MGQLSATEIQPWIIKRILSFFNRAKTASDITDMVLDNPSGGTGTTGYGIGTTVAQRILDQKKRLKPPFFKSFSQLNGIEGLGQDKLDDLAYTFRLSSAEQFVVSMFQQVILNNWELEHVTKEYDDDAEFQEIIRSPKLLREEVGELLNEVAAIKYDDSPLAELATELLNNTYLDLYESSDQAQYAWALWFYRFDSDNWFSFEQVRKVIQQYLDEFWNPQDNIGFALFKGFRGGDIWGSGVIDLPVTFSTAERRLSIWRAVLND